MFSLLFFPYAEESEESEDEMVKLRPVFVGPVSGETIKHRSCSFLMTYSVPSPQLEGLPPDLPHLPPSRLESLHLICACGAALERPCGFSTQTAMSEAQTEKVTQTCAFSHVFFRESVGAYYIGLNSTCSRALFDTCNGMNGTGINVREYIDPKMIHVVWVVGC